MLWKAKVDPFANLISFLLRFKLPIKGTHDFIDLLLQLFKLKYNKLTSGKGIRC